MTSSNEPADADRVVLRRSLGAVVGAPLVVVLARVSCERKAPAVLSCHVDATTPLESVGTDVDSTQVVGATTRSGFAVETGATRVELALADGKTVALTPDVNDTTGIPMARLAADLDAFIHGSGTSFEFSQPVAVATPVWIVGGALLLFGDRLHVWSRQTFMKRRSKGSVPLGQCADVGVTRLGRTRTLVIERRDGDRFALGPAGAEAHNRAAVLALLDRGRRAAGGAS